MFFCGFGLFTNCTVDSLMKGLKGREKWSDEKCKSESVRGRARVEGLKGKNSQHVPANERERERVRGH